MKPNFRRSGPPAAAAALKVSARRLARAVAAATLAFAAVGLAPAAHSDTITYKLPDIGSFSTFSDTNTADSFFGTGFVGLYGPRTTDSFSHLVGLELNDFSRTALNVDVSGLAGSTINQATLSFDLLDGAPGSQTFTATSFNANGTLAYAFDPPSDLGTASGTTSNPALDSLDVTNLLANRVGSGADWFGLYLEGSTLQQFTYAYDFVNSVPLPDQAQMRLTVDYTPCVPEPGSLALLVTGGLPLLSLLRRRGARLPG